MFGSGNLLRFYSRCLGCVETEKKRSRLEIGTALLIKRVLLQNRFVEFFPIVEVVEVDGVFASARVVSQAVSAED
jgi:hypothetical protein